MPPYRTRSDFVDKPFDVSAFVTLPVQVHVCVDADCKCGLLLIEVDSCKVRSWAMLLSRWILC
jgi:hypothetical protein